MKKTIKLTAVQLGLALFVSLMFGWIIAPKGEAEIKEVPVEVVKEVEVIREVEKNLSEWQNLKTIDDAGFEIAASNMTLCSQGFQAILNMDTAEMERVTREVNRNSEELNKLADERASVLNKLGY